MHAPQDLTRTHSLQLIAFVVVALALGTTIWRLAVNNAKLAGPKVGVPMASNLNWLPATGYRIEDIEGERRGSANRVVWISHAARLTILLIRRPDCRHCDEVAAQWPAFVQGLNGGELLGTATVELIEFSPIDTHDGILAEPEVLSRLGILNHQLLPAILLVDGGGVVIRSWPAVLDDAQRAEIETTVVQASRQEMER